MARSISFLLLSVFIMLPLLILQGCGCGFDCNDDDDNDPGAVTLGFSDAPIDDVSEVVLTVDKITFRRANADDVVVDNFTIPALGLADAESFQIDLLSYLGVNQLLVIEGLALDAGQYSSLVVTLLDGDVNQSYVEETTGNRKPLNATASELVLSGIKVSSGEQAFTIEFGLGQSLLYSGGSGSYTLTTEGVRVVDNDSSATLSGSIDSALFDQVAPCDSKVDPEASNRLYLYQGINLGVDKLADVFTSASSTTPVDGAVAPFAVMVPIENSLTGSWEYAFGYLPAGDYTLAFSCDAVDDDPIDYDGLSVPLPVDQHYEINLGEGDSVVCNLASGASCS